MFANQGLTFKGIFSLVVVSLLILVASCGGGGTASMPNGIDQHEEIGLGSKPAPGTANLSGNLVLAAGTRAVRQAEPGLPGAIVELIDTLTGGTAGSDVTGSMGEFEIKGVPSGDHYLIKVEFTSSEDLDGDGAPDQIELYFPVNLADQAVVELLQRIGIVDSNNDGQLDAVEVNFELNDDKGNSDSQSSQFRRRDGQTLVDDNGDGQFDDSEAMDDSDADGLPDASSPDDNSGSGMHELEVRGLIAAIGGGMLTVGEVEFSYSDSTKWLNNDNSTATPASFSEGMLVEIEALPDGSGGWIAIKVKAEDSTDDSTPGSPSQDEQEVKGVIEAIDAGSITVGGITFAIAESTEWLIHHDPAAAGDFAAGMFVEVKGMSDGAGGWIAERVKREDSADDSMSGGGNDDNPDVADDNGGGNDDNPDVADDNGGGNDDNPDVADDNGGGNDDDPDVADDNGGGNDDPQDDNGGGGDSGKD